MRYSKPEVVKLASSIKGVKGLPKVIICICGAPKFEIGQMPAYEPDE